MLYNVRRLVIGALIVIAGGLSVMGGCVGGETTKKPQTDARNRIEDKAETRVPYEPRRDVEFNNYNAAQKVYDSPDTIQWCSTTWGNASAPIVTVPVAGKLTSSSVSFFPNERWVDRGNYAWYRHEARSVDGMYHGSPPPYRYGFTPGGQYVDFFNMPTFCTTALTKFQREATKVAVTFDAQAEAAQRLAEAALKRDGSEPGERTDQKRAAERALEGLDN